MPTKRVYSKNADLWFDLTYTEGDVYNADLDILFDPTAPFFTGDESGGGGGSGADGKSAYQIWLEQPGNAGKTVEEFLESLKGEDGDDAGGPSDAYSPTNKPRLSALGTADYTLPANVPGNNPINARMGGPVFPASSAERIYASATVPLRNVAGGELLFFALVKRVGSAWFIERGEIKTLTSGQSSATFAGPFTLSAGTTYGWLFGMNSGTSDGQLDRFYGDENRYPGNPELLLTDSLQVTSQGSDTGSFQVPSQLTRRAFNLTGLSIAKGVEGKIDPPDITFSGTTAQRPVNMPVGFQYFDTTLSQIITWTGSEWQLPSTGGGSGPSFEPTKARDAQVTSSSAGAKLLRATFVTNAARTDGADIRVYDPDDAMIPCYVYSIVPDAGGLKYSVAWLGTLLANTPKTYRIRYGDTDAEPQRLSSADVSNLVFAAKNGLMFYDRLLSSGPDVAYVPSDFATAGTEIYGNRDDGGEIRALPAPLDFAGNTYSTVFHGPNGWMIFEPGTGGAPIPSGGSGQISPSANAFAIMWCNGDIYEVWRREVILSDGYAWHIKAGPGGYTGGIELTVRYQNVGIWTVTMFHNSVTNDLTLAQAPILALGVAGEKRLFMGGNIDRDTPSSWLAYRFGMIPVIATVAAQGDYPIL